MKTPPATLLDVPTTPGKVVTELHAWIATHADGSEGIIGALVPGPTGHSLMPLMSSDRWRVDQLEHKAREAMALSKGRGAAEVLAVTLSTFRRVADA